MRLLIGPVEPVISSQSKESGLIDMSTGYRLTSKAQGMW